MSEREYRSIMNEVVPVEFEDIVSTIPDIDSLSEVELGRLCEVKEEIESNKKLFPILYYKPQAHQAPFHRSLKKMRLCTGGNQSGKTIATCSEGIMLSLGIHPYRKIRVPNKGRVVATDLQKGIGEVVGAKYKELIPMSEVRRMKYYPGGEYKKCFWKNGSVTEFMSYEQDDLAFEGWVGDWVQFDEPPPRSKYVACMRGLMRYKGICFMALTPLSEPWIYDEIYTQTGAGVDQPDVFTFDINDNKYLSKAEIADFESRLTEDEKEARLHGRFQHLSGLIYKEFNPSVHIVDAFDIPKEWTRYNAMDYHPRVPCALGWIAVSPQGRFYAYDELWVNDTVRNICEAVKAKEGTNVIRARFIDPLSATPDRISGSCAQREFIRSGLAYRSATKDFAIGKNLVCEALKLDKEGKAGIYFLRGRVPRTIEAITHYQWDEYAKGDDKGQKETPKKKYAHFCDVVRYILVTRPSHVSKETQQLEGIAEEMNEKKHRFTGYGG